MSNVSTSAGKEAGNVQSALTEKQRALLTRCQLPLRLLDAAFLEAAGPDKQPALIHALEVSQPSCNLVQCKLVHVMSCWHAQLDRHLGSSVKG